MWSGPTPAGGVTAEIVEWNDKSDVRGKLVLTRQNPANIKWNLVKKGVLGAINTFTENPELQDGRQWINAWGDNGWAFTKGSAPLICFSITPRQAAFVRKLLAEGRTVRAHALVDTRYYAGVYPYVTGVIPGSGSEEEVLTLGHSSEQGAQDNATGVAAMLESLALNRLIAEGKLPRPKRTIRVLLMGEMYGSMHYMSTHLDRARRTVAAMCVDTPAAPYNLAGTEYTFYMNPHVAKSYTDAFVLHVAELYLPKVERPWHWHEFMSGTDTYLAEPTVGIPTVWPYSGTGIVSHHNSEDKADQVDPRSLRDLAIINATYLYYLANAGEREPRLAELAITAAMSRSSGRRLQRSPCFDAHTERNGARARAGYGQGQLSVDRESQSVLSVTVIPKTAGTPSARRSPRRNGSKIMATPVRRLRDAATAGLCRSGWARESSQDESDPQIRCGVHRVKRNGSAPSHCRNPPGQSPGFPSGAWDGTAIAAL
jgi:hypothetical protein